MSAMNIYVTEDPVIIEINNNQNMVNSNHHVIPATQQQSNEISPPITHSNVLTQIPISDHNRVVSTLSTRQLPELIVEVDNEAIEIKYMFILSHIGIFFLGMLFTSYFISDNNDKNIIRYTSLSFIFVISILIICFRKIIVKCQLKCAKNSNRH